MKGPIAYVCGAGVAHYDKQSRVEAWKRAEQKKAAAEAAAKIEAHDDYMAAMARFRQKAMGHIHLANHTGNFVAGYRLAMKDMDEALIEIMAEKEITTDGSN
jgi:hypothetical protein